MHPDAAASPPASGRGGPPASGAGRRRLHRDDDGRDALHILPLSILPLGHPGLRRARLIKNVRLETVAEVFNDAQTGSGQITIDQIPLCFGLDADAVARDLHMIRQIAAAASFDIYSLRLELRRLKIDVDEARSLRLSDAKRARLTGYMRVFTRPLIEYVYGTGDAEVTGMDGLLRMFSNPDVAEARRRLQLIADRLDIPVSAIPRFLEDYADVFMSLAYFRQCLDEIVPDVEAFLTWTRELQDSSEVRRDSRRRRMLDDIVRDLTEITTSITGRFESFDLRSRAFWTNINAESFHTIRTLILNHHLTIGGVLCGLAVKMDLWKARFARGGGPVRRMEFIRSEILPGLSQIRAIERSSRAALW